MTQFGGRYWLMIVSAVALAVAAGCAQMKPEPPAVSAAHLSSADVGVASGIPAPVTNTPYIPPPEPIPARETYTVVVNDVPVRELLFALARDAELNVDIAGDIDGRVTLNAIEQTLPQILQRIARQVSLRYEIDGDQVYIERDEPFFRTYEVGYVNLSRDVDTVVNVATQVATTGSGAAQAGAGAGGSGGGSGSNNNTSATRLNSRSYNRFWETLYRNISAILGETDVGVDGDRVSNRVIVNAESGVITVKADSAQHEMIQSFIDQVLYNARRQVMIEATIVEVALNDQYQGGVDWNALLLEDKAGVAGSQQLLGAITDGVIDSAVSSFVLGFSDPNNNDRLINLTLRLLREFGDTRVLSSPRLMVLNNQTAVLKVVQELVYFTIQINDRDATINQNGRTLIQSEVNSVPVGLVMAVTPQISRNDQVTLTVRPTISQKVGDAIDPATQIVGQFLNVDDSLVTNLVPIIQTREMESVLRLTNGQVAVLGGLMRDELREGDREVPGLARIPLIGDLLFNTQEQVVEKSELVIFIRPVVVNDPSLETDLEAYKQFLTTTVRPGP